MNTPRLLLLPVSLCLLTLVACAQTTAFQSGDADTPCSKSKSAANGASCKADGSLGPPVVDISRPAPSPGVAAPAEESPAK